MSGRALPRPSLTPAQRTEDTGQSRGGSADTQTAPNVPPTRPHAGPSRGAFVVVFLTPARSSQATGGPDRVRGLQGSWNTHYGSCGLGRVLPQSRSGSQGPRSCQPAPRLPATSGSSPSPELVITAPRGARRNRCPRGEALASEVTSVTARPDRGRTGGPAGRDLGNPGCWTRQEDSPGQVTSVVPRDWDQAETQGCSGSHIHVLEGPRALTSIPVWGPWPGAEPPPESRHRPW